MYGRLWVRGPNRGLWLELLKKLLMWVWGWWPLQVSLSSFSSTTIHEPRSELHFCTPKPRNACDCKSKSCYIHWVWRQNLRVLLHIGWKKKALQPLSNGCRLRLIWKFVLYHPILIIEAKIQNFVKSRYLRFQKVICFCPLRIVIENLSLSLSP